MSYGLSNFSVFTSIRLHKAHLDVLRGDDLRILFRPRDSATIFRMCADFSEREKYRPV